MKIVNINGKNLHLLNDMKNFNEIFRKDGTYDIIKSHQKPRFYPHFWKNHREGGQVNPLPPPRSFLRVKTWGNKNNENKTHQTFTLTKFFESLL